MNEFIKKEDFVASLKLKQKKLAWTASFFMWLMGLSRINKDWQKIPNKNSSLKTFDDILNYYGNTVKFNVDAYKNLPNDGPFITISNHPFGMWDGVVLVKVIGEKRPDIKVMAYEMLNKIPIGSYFIPVDPFKTNEQTKNSLFGTKLALQQLREGRPLGIFPAGEVSFYQKKSKKVEDRIWQLPIIKLIQKAKVPIVPVFFYGENSKTFLLLGRINAMLAKSFLNREFLNKTNQQFSISIGKPITVEEQQAFSSLEDYSLFLRNKVYELKTSV